MSGLLLNATARYDPLCRTSYPAGRANRQGFPLAGFFLRRMVSKARHHPTNRLTNSKRRAACRARRS